jgi:hypothetical protein
MMPGSKTQPSSGEAHRLQRWRAVIKRFTVVLLLFTVAGLFSMAKTGQYYPKSNPAQHVSVSIKMNVVHSSLEAAEEPLQVVTRFLPPQLPVRRQQVQPDESPRVVPIGVTVSMQHRSPPAAL